MTLREMIAAAQRKLGVLEDGCAGPQTWGAIYRSVVLGDAAHAPGEHPSDMTVLDERSEANLQGVLPGLRPLARALVHEANGMLPQGWRFKVISGRRTRRQQEVLWLAYQRGGQKASPPGHSNHETGRAFDVGIFGPEGEYCPESPRYREAGVIGERLGLRWGGRFGDEPHFELKGEA